MFAPPRGLSQLTTSFIASRCQGIHSLPLTAWLHHSGFQRSLSRKRINLEVRGFEPLTSCLQSRRSSQLSYTPRLGLDRLELSTSPLSGVRSNHLSYRPKDLKDRGAWANRFLNSLRKEVIQPHLPVRLPCYDFTPLTRPTLTTPFPYGLGIVALSGSDSGGVTGGVYKARERIHRGVADPRLLAIPTSCRRVAACNPY